MKIDTKKLDAVIKTYLRAAIAAVGALYLADPARPAKDYFAAGLAAVLGPVLKSIDPKASEFGIGSK